MKRILFTFTSLLFALSICGQITFEKTYDIYNSALPSLVFSQDDGYLMAMVSKGEKCLLSFVKTDFNGDTLWTKGYDIGLTYNDDILVGAEDDEGYLYIATRTINSNVLKLDKDCNIIWNKKYSFMDLKMTFKDNLLWICEDAGPGNYLFKIDASTGDSLWRSELFNDDIFPGLYSRATSIVALDNGDLVVTVSLVNFYGEMYKSNFYRLPANSNELVRFTLPTDEVFVVSDSKSYGNEIISIANDVRFSSDHKTCFFIKYTSDGTLQTIKKEVFEYNYVMLQNSVITNENQVVASGMIITGANSGNVMLHCFSLNGDSLWTQLQGNRQVTSWDLTIANDNGFVITGGEEFEYDSYKPYLLKTNSLGELTGLPEKAVGQDIQVYPNPASDQATFHTPGVKSGTLTIFNPMGKLCSEIPVICEKTIWNCNHVRKGVYLYRIVNDDGIVSGKIVVSR